MNINIHLETGYQNMRFDEITDMLGKAFWSLGISRSEVEKGARNSALLMGAFTAENRQIGYARVISDRTRFAYITDVIVHEDYRKNGIGQSMIMGILESKELADVYQWLLITKDAHDVYRKAGFSITTRPSDWMEIRKPRPQR
jgi:N-acetylglutamate synthase-like GNAT family acetyltransferase